MCAGLAASVAAGCSGESERDTAGSGTSVSLSITASASEEGSASATDPSGDGTSADSGSSSPTQGEADSNEAGANPKFDLGLQPDVELVEETGCTKVDFLFVIDNSGSMGDNQMNLAANVPNFVNGIQATLAEVNEYQVGVITTDDYSGGGGGTNPAACKQLGALVTSTTSGGACGPYVDGGNYMTEADNLGVAFPCAAIVGSGGNGAERPANAMEVAVRGDLGGPGGCNEGFIRDDALLVIVIITDEWDGPGDPESIFGGGGSTGDANTWFTTVTNAKGNIEENVVVLSLVHFAGCPPTDGFLAGDLEVFTNMFTNGFLGCIADDYSMIFNEATSLIEDACDNFMPPG